MPKTRDNGNSWAGRSVFPAEGVVCDSSPRNNAGGGEAKSGKAIFRAAAGGACE